MRVLLAGLAGLLLLPSAVSAQPFGDAEQEEIRRIVREYLLENPEVIEEAIIELRARRDAEEAERQRAAIAELHDELYNDERDFSVGPVDAPVQIVEFFDYNCPYCRASASWVKSTIEAHPDKVRFVFKEAPIFQDSKESSDTAARAAVAAIGQERYLDLHFALMESSGTIPLSQVRRIAESVGLNWRNAQSVMDSPETTQQLQHGLDLLDAIGGADAGTPAFVVNGELIRGADIERLEALVAAAVGGGGDGAP
jgi:protein-disulfide isomerase